MVKFGNSFGARSVNPASKRQMMLACKAQGLVFNPETGECRAPLRRGKAPSGAPTLASLREACKAQGLVLDMETRQCRESRRGAGLEAARAARAAKRGTGMTQAQMAAACKAQGLVFDRDTKQCRPSKRAVSGLERAYARGSLFFGKNKFGVRPVNPASKRQMMLACKARGLVFDPETGECRAPLRRGRAPSGAPTLALLREACKAQGLVLDMETRQCRESRRGAGLEAARAARAAKRGTGMTQAQMAAACKAQGLVFDRDTKQCRPSKRAVSGLERAYARGSLFFGKNKFGLNRPPAAQRAGIIYHSPASQLTGDVFDVTGITPTGKVTGPESLMLPIGAAPASLQAQAGILMPKIPGQAPKATPKK